jgi:hypothetical protein
VQPFSSKFAVQKVTSTNSGKVSKLPKPVKELCLEFSGKCNSENLPEICKEVFNALAVTEENIKSVEQFTTDQNKCVLWYEQRLGRITASSLHEASATSLSYPSPSLLNKIIKESTHLTTVPSIQWGIDHEEDAKREFIILHAVTHEHVVVQKAGLVISAAYPYLAASPDGWVKDSCCEMAVLEIKCPFSIRHCHPTSTPYLQLQSDGTYDLNRNHSYYTQVQGQLNVCNVNTCYFVVWTLMGIVVVKIVKDEKFFTDLVPHLQSLFVHCVLPSILTGQLQSTFVTSSSRCRQLTGNDVTDAVCSKQRKYCTCNVLVGGRRICCGHKDCSYEWFHYKCVGLKRTPRSATWMCSFCAVKL